MYAAYARCKQCNAGLAYVPLKHDAWYCSAVIKGEVWDDPKYQHDCFPFVFWEIKSEMQPSANGNTTRPKKD